MHSYWVFCRCIYMLLYVHMYVNIQFVVELMFVFLYWSESVNIYMWCVQSKTMFGISMYVKVWINKKQKVLKNNKNKNNWTVVEMWYTCVRTHTSLKIRRNLYSLLFGWRFFFKAIFVLLLSPTYVFLHPTYF